MKFDLIVVGVISLDTTLKIPFLPIKDSECFVQELFDAHGGSGANVAAYASFYGGLEVGLVGRIGDDLVGDELLERLHEYKINIKGVHRTKGIHSTRIITGLLNDGSKSYFVYLGAHKKLTVSNIPRIYLDNAQSFYIAPCAPSVHIEFFKFLKDQDKYIYFNPGSVYIQEGEKSSLQQLISDSNVLFVNEFEALNYSGCNTLDAAGSFFIKLGLEYVIITNSSLGSYMFNSSDDMPIIIPSVSADYVSSIGAGDSFSAGFLSEYIQSGDPISSVVNGNLFGAFGITQLEIRKSKPNRNELDDFIRKINN